MQYRYVAPSSHFVRNGVSLDFRVASLLKIQFACTSPSGSSPRWGAKNVLPLNLIALPRGEGCDTRMRLYPKHSLEGKEEAASPQKRKPTPPRCARQPLPREGARVDTPSFLRKEVPRRGGGWMGEAVFLCPSLPRVGKVASGASRIGF